MVLPSIQRPIPYQAEAEGADVVEDVTVVIKPIGVIEAFRKDVPATDEDIKGMVVVEVVVDAMKAPLHQPRQ